MGNIVYFELKSVLNKNSGEKIILSDIVEFSSPSEYKDKIGSIVVFPDGINNLVKITAIQVVKLIMEKVRDVAVIPLGSSQVILRPISKAGNPVFNIIKVLGASLLLFLGSALAIMYFHADVNMKEVHKSVYYFITGSMSDRPMVLNLSYSVGLGVGVALFFDVFKIRKKKKNPGPLELELHQNELELNSYLINTNEELDSN